MLLLLFASAAAETEVAPTTGGSYLAEHYRHLGKQARKQRKKRRERDKRIEETIRETYRRIHGLVESREAPPGAAREVRRIVAPAVKTAAQKAPESVPAPSAINFAVLAEMQATVARLDAILAEMQRADAARIADEEEDEDLMLMAA
jgi:hypothetical protein